MKGEREEEERSRGEMDELVEEEATYTSSSYASQRTLDLHPPPPPPPPLFLTMYDDHLILKVINRSTGARALADSPHTSSSSLCTSSRSPIKPSWFYSGEQGGGNLKHGQHSHLDENTHSVWISTSVFERTIDSLQPAQHSGSVMLEPVLRSQGRGTRFQSDNQLIRGETNQQSSAILVPAQWQQQWGGGAVMEVDPRAGGSSD
ncbi:unnamed protein product [Pleuronectes platessa]|uniref:Uncharacterized protein n=1 Tax=Pleuronectes platessa TaxID=8262 RepID=A0A9N7Y7E7_PLEPL|nr:unnamed protein product [Pleuronectes platessa]